MSYGEESIRLHRASRGKVATLLKMPLETLEDLALAYTPGVAAVSLAIAHDKSEVYALTGKGNTVAVVTDGSAVLGLGNVGPEAALPVMEGKAILFKSLGDVDAVPICLGTQDTQAIIDTVRYLAPTFGGINLEDIAAPRCFDVEDGLQDLGIPVFHDDQHGTAIVTLAALVNALKVTGRRLEETAIVIAGAGAAGIAVARLLRVFGAPNMTLVDSREIIHKGRRDLTPVKASILEFTNPNDRRGGLAEALRGADVFIGLSVAGIVDQAMVRSMGKGPIVFAMANPVSEIAPELALEAGAAVVGTGRSDYANQINNCLAFPGVFRGALDVRATRITREMMLAGARALADLVPRPVPTAILPSPLDRSVVAAIAAAVAEAWKMRAGLPVGVDATGEAQRITSPSA